MPNLYLVALIAIMAAPCVAHSQTGGDAKRGEVYARQICADCHATTDEDHFSLPTKAPSFTAVANSAGMTETAVIVWLRTPHPTMPNFIIEPPDQKDLAAYIIGLRTAR